MALTELTEGIHYRRAHLRLSLQNSEPSGKWKSGVKLFPELLTVLWSMTSEYIRISEWVIV